MITINQLAHRCDKVRWRGRDSFTACCVAHDDRNPSMTVTQDGDMILAHCFAGCPQDAVIDALGIKSTESRDFVPAPRVRVAPDYSGTEARATRAVELSTPAPDNHAYLLKKRCQPHGIGVLSEAYPGLPTPVRNGGNVLVIPMRNISGEVLSCQFINEEGGKAYMRGSKRKGGFYTIKGEGKCVWICEGFATGASLHQDSGNSVLVAFDSGGLMAVTGAVIAAYGTSREFIIMADDDWKTSGNPGLSKAKAAAQTHGIKVRMPDFTGLDRGDKHTDYNDMAVLKHG